MVFHLYDWRFFHPYVVPKVYLSPLPGIQYKPLLSRYLWSRMHFHIVEALLTFFASIVNNGTPVRFDLMRTISPTWDKVQAFQLVNLLWNFSLSDTKICPSSIAVNILASKVLMFGECTWLKKAFLPAH